MRKNNKSHAVCLPFPAQGHVNPMMQFARLLHSQGFLITFVNTEFNHKRLIQSRGPDFLLDFPGFRFHTIPDGLPPSDRNATQDVPSICDATRKNCLSPFKALLSTLDPPVTCIVSDAIMGFADVAARDLSIPRVLHLWTSSACSLLGCWMFDKLVDQGIVPFESEHQISLALDSPVECPGVTHMRLRDLPTFLRTLSTDDIMFDFIGSEARNCLASPAPLIFNTFHELDKDVLEAVSTLRPQGSKLYAIGPIPLMVERSALPPFSSSLWKEDSACLDWLDKKPKGSVVYVNYGSVTTMSQRDLHEFAWGLAKSGHNFVWIVRPDVVEGSESATLPKGFVEEIEGRGFLAEWCPQQQVLGHEAVGAFLTHCGWNSSSESIGSGVPLLGWPFFGDQQMTCRRACTVWGNGVEVEPCVERNAVAGLVREVMENGESGIRVKRNALEWRSKAVEATRVGGSSYTQFQELINLMLSDC